MVVIVSNTSPLITLEKMQGGFDFIGKLYDQIIIPPAVLQEVSALLPSTQAYPELHNLTDLIKVETDFPLVGAPGVERLDPGEVEAISLASKLGKRLLIEERDGRGVAEQLGLEISGIGGQIYRAFRTGLIKQEDQMPSAN